jgi:hypothetical protein
MTNQRNYWLIGGNFNGNTADSQEIEEEIQEKIIRYGYDDTASHNAWRFYNEIKCGDIVLAARNRHTNCECLFAGVASGNVNISGHYQELMVVNISEKSAIATIIKQNYEDMPGGDSTNPYGPIYSCKDLDRTNNGQNTLITKLEEIFMDYDYALEPLKELVKSSRNLILTGAPGTGKTYDARQVAQMLGDDSSHIESVQFHPSFDYTDFVEGLRPSNDSTGGGAISFKLVDGVFKSFCAKAAKSLVSDDSQKYVFIIDEINRGDIAKIFGEVFSLIEPDYRVSKEHIEILESNERQRYHVKSPKRSVKTQYSNISNGNDIFAEGFFIPDNVYIIGTMNDIDRSVEIFDLAFRRRFAWKELTVEDSKRMLYSWVDENGKPVLTQEELSQIILRMDQLNEVILGALGAEYQIGASYFRNYIKCGKNFDNLWKWHIDNVLKEYLRGRPDRNELSEKMKNAYDAIVGDCV